MDRLKLLTLAAAVAFCGPTFVAGQAATPTAVTADAKADDSPWTLVWSDEFNVDGAPDEKTWKFEQGFVRNEEPQWYQPDNAAFGRGADHRSPPRAQDQPQLPGRQQRLEADRQYAEYTSTSMHTAACTVAVRPLRDARPHRDARRAVAGLVDAGVSGEWPSNGEIDIMEYYQGNMLANACWSAGRGTRRCGTIREPISDLRSDWSTQFHVWRMDWMRTRSTFTSTIR